LPADGNEELPAREVHRAEYAPEPRKEIPVATVRAAEPAAPPRRRTSSSEPRLERIVVGQQLEVSTEDASASTAPARKGWWQRKLGGE
jgi:ribonuclease E